MSDENQTGLHSEQISSPAATGGAGTFFEQHVAAYWLAQLLVGSIPPIIYDCTVEAVHLQTNHLGWQTDDFLVVGINGAGHRRKLAGQVKRTFNLSATNEECKKAFLDFWNDFKNLDRFSSTDRLVLLTFRGTNTLLEHFAGLLDCARASRDAAEFDHRLSVPGFINSKSIAYCATIRTILEEHENRPIAISEVWPFLRTLHLLSLDLDSSTQQTEAAIKSLLAYTSKEQDGIGAAEASWNALLELVSVGMREARSYGRSDLPATLLERHSPVGTTEHQALKSLRDHSSVILEGIRSTIGNELHLSRTKLVQRVIENLETAKIVLVVGSAGSGKSAIAKDVIGVLTEDCFAFSFRAEEFDTTHIDETLQRCQIQCNARTLGAILAGQGRKVLLIDSIERLLETSNREAFSDLLNVVKKDTSWQIVLTCRDYSADIVRDAFLKATNSNYSIVLVPQLDDQELEDIEIACPTLAGPLENAKLKQLLRSPYVVDLALRIPWSEQPALPQSEKEFRVLFWQMIVRVHHRQGNGMPQRRDEAFGQVALRRARTLSLYADCHDLDQVALEALRHDSLVVSPRDNETLAAPAHDVLEDWAILQWIGRQYQMHEGSLSALSSELGAYPAIRRTYRKWISELVMDDGEAADSVFHDAVQNEQLPPHFRDDTLAALLRTPASADLLTRNQTAIFENNKQLFRRVVHLLRVACMVTPTWFPSTINPASINYVPDGPAWATVLKLTHIYVDSFTPDDYLLILGLIEDWAAGVSFATPYPNGFEDVTAIGHWLLAQLDDYRSNDRRKRVFRVLAKIPNGDKARFASMLLNNPNDRNHRSEYEDFRKIVLEGLDGIPMVRDMPEEFISVARDYILCSETDVQTGWTHNYRDVEAVFGVRLFGTAYLPPSAYHGPYLQLLRYHPVRGLEFCHRRL